MEPPAIRRRGDAEKYRRPMQTAQAEPRAQICKNGSRANAPGFKKSKIIGHISTGGQTVRASFFSITRDRGGGGQTGGKSMNLNRLLAMAERQGYEITIDKSGQQWAYTIHDPNIETNPDIHTDRRGLEIFLQEGPGEYAYYCEYADEEPFT